MFGELFTELGNEVGPLAQTLIQVLVKYQVFPVDQQLDGLSIGRLAQCGQNRTLQVRPSGECLAGSFGAYLNDLHKQVHRNVGAVAQDGEGGEIIFVLGEKVDERVRYFRISYQHVRDLAPVTNGCCRQQVSRQLQKNTFFFSAMSRSASEEFDC